MHCPSAQQGTQPSSEGCEAGWGLLTQDAVDKNLWLRKSDVVGVRPAAEEMAATLQIALCKAKGRIQYWRQERRKLTHKAGPNFGKLKSSDFVTATYASCFFPGLEVLKFVVGSITATL